MEVIKIYLTLNDFVTPCLLLLTLKDCFLWRLLWLTIKNSQTGLNTWRLSIILQTDFFEDLQNTGTLQE